MTYSFQTENISCKKLNQVLFANLNIQLHSGELLVVMGQNGSGKSSLLKMLGGLHTPADGRITWQGKCIQQHSAFYRQDLHYLSHLNGTKLDLTVSENLQLAKLFFPSTTHQAIPEVFALAELQSLPVRLLSAGQRRRVALARLCLSPKPLWILDEPLTSLDVEMQNLFLEMLTNHLKQGGIAIVSSHQTLPQVATELRLPVC